jgi:hypothetical protein
MEERRWRKFSICHRGRNGANKPRLTLLCAVVPAMLSLHSCLSCSYVSFFLREACVLRRLSSPLGTSYGLRLSSRSTLNRIQYVGRRLAPL